MKLADHLSVEDLKVRYQSAVDLIEKGRFHGIYLLAKGYVPSEVAAIVAKTPRWLDKIVARYNQEGPDALADRRHSHPGRKPLLSDADWAVLRERLAAPAPDGGLWTSAKVAAWMARRLGVDTVHAQRGWEALQKAKFSLQVPRPRHPRAATPQEQEDFKKNSMTRSRP
jgi:transposase